MEPDTCKNCKIFNGRSRNLKGVRGEQQGGLGRNEEDGVGAFLKLLVMEQLTLHSRPPTSVSSRFSENLIRERESGGELEVAFCVYGNRENLSHKRKEREYSK